MPLTANHTVGQFIVERPNRSRILEKFGISYCCKAGEMPLTDACAKQGIGSEEVLRQLLEESAASNVDGMHDVTLTALADHIEQTHHSWLRDELPRIDGLLRRVARAHGNFSPWVIEMLTIYEALQEELFSHMTKEEQILFPLIRRTEAGLPLPGPMQQGIDGPIACMEHEHDSALTALARMRELSNGFTPPESACNTFRAMLDSLAELETDMRLHIHKENDILFPKALNLVHAQVPTS